MMIANFFGGFGGDLSGPFLNRSCKLSSSLKRKAECVTSASNVLHQTQQVEAEGQAQKDQAQSYEVP